MSLACEKLNTEHTDRQKHRSHSCFSALECSKPNTCFMVCLNVFHTFCYSSLTCGYWRCHPVLWNRFCRNSLWQTMTAWVRWVGWVGRALLIRVRDVGHYWPLCWMVIIPFFKSMLYLWHSWEVIWMKLELYMCIWTYWCHCRELSW